MMDFISAIPRHLLRHAVRRQRRIWVWIWIRAVWWYGREGWQFYGMGRRREIRVVFGRSSRGGGRIRVLLWHDTSYVIWPIRLLN